MSYHVVKWVLERSPVDVVSHRFVLTVLGEHASHDGHDARPSVGRVAALTKLSERQVQRALKELQNAGHIECTGTHESGTRIWRVVMDRADEFHAANWSAEQESTRPTNGDRPRLDYRKRGGDTTSPPDTVSPPTPRHPGDTTSPEPPEPSLLNDSDVDRSNGSDGWGDTTSPPGRHDVTPRLADAWRRAYDVLELDARNTAAASVYLGGLELQSGDERHVVLQAPALVADAVRDDWLPKISDAFAETIGRRPTIHIVAAPEQRDPALAEWLAMGDEAGPEAAGRPSPGSGSTVSAAREGAT